MSAIEEDLTAYLLAQSAINALIVDRMYPARLPQNGTLPAVTYQRIAGVPEISHDGAVNLTRSRIQIDCWALTYSAMASLAAAIEAALSGYVGAMGSTPSTATRVLNIIDLPEPEPKLWRRLLDVAIWHST